jgi:hypothetical protein
MFPPSQADFDRPPRSNAVRTAITPLPAFSKCLHKLPELDSYEQVAPLIARSAVPRSDDRVRESMVSPLPASRCTAECVSLLNDPPHLCIHILVT